jgi:hypothetical protein
MMWERENGSLLLQHLSHMQSEGRPMFDPLCKLSPGLARPLAPTAGAFFFAEFVESADSAPAPQIAPLPGNGSDEQMFGAEQQIPHGARSD